MTDSPSCEICRGTLSNRFCHGLNGDGPIVHVECETNARRLYPPPAPPAQPDAAALRAVLLAYEMWRFNWATEAQPTAEARVDAFLRAQARAAAGGGK